MGPYRNTIAIQSENDMKIKLNRHNIHGNVSKNVNFLNTTQCSISYYHQNKPNYNNTYTDNKNNNASAIITTSALTYRFKYNIIVMPNYASVQQLTHQFGFNYTIHAAKKAGFIDKLEDYYTKCRLVTMFQNRGNYLRLNEIVMIYFSVYYKILVYEEGSLKEALSVEMDELLSLIEMDGREIIVRLCEPYQSVRNDILSIKIASINFRI